MRGVSYIVVLGLLLFPLMSLAAPAHISEECARKFQVLEDELYYGGRCETDADCMVTHFGCPFGCGTPLNKKFDTATFGVKKKLYENECSQCVYRCAKEQKELMCAKGQCRMIYYSEIEAWRAEEKRKAERERQEFIEHKYNIPKRERTVGPQ